MLQRCRSCNLTDRKPENLVFFTVPRRLEPSPPWVHPWLRSKSTRCACLGSSLCVASQERTLPTSCRLASLPWLSEHSSDNGRHPRGNTAAKCAHWQRGGQENAAIVRRECRLCGGNVASGPRPPRACAGLMSLGVGWDGGQRHPVVLEGVEGGGRWAEGGRRRGRRAEGRKTERAEGGGRRTEDGGRRGR